jgi:hypothetical protein
MSEKSSYIKVGKHSNEGKESEVIAIVDSGKI